MLRHFQPGVPCAIVLIHDTRSTGTLSYPLAGLFVPGYMFTTCTGAVSGSAASISSLSPTDAPNHPSSGITLPHLPPPLRFLAAAENAQKMEGFSRLPRFFARSSAGFEQLPGHVGALGTVHRGARARRASAAASPGSLARRQISGLTPRAQPPSKPLVGSHGRFAIASCQSLTRPAPSPAH